MILLDWAILISLMTTIIYCWKLNNKILEFKKGRKELQDLIKNFDYSMEKAEVSIKELKELSNKASYVINEKLEKAKLLADDLSFINDRATNLADKLEKHISISRKIELSSLDKNVAESAIEKQYSKKLESVELKKSTIESLLARIANVKENNKINQQENLFKKKTYTEEV